MDDFTLDRGAKARGPNVRRGSDRITNVTSSPKMRPSLAERRSSLVPSGDVPHKGHGHALDELFMQMAGLIRDAKTKRKIRKTKRHFASDEALGRHAEVARTSHTDNSPRHAERRPSVVSRTSQDSFDLEKLEDLLERGLTISNTLNKTASRTLYGPSSRQTSSRKLRTLSMNASSDTEYHDGDVTVPACEAILDNSKTLSYLGGSSELLNLDKEAKASRDAWEAFKFEIVRLTHTLKLKGWRHVPMDRSKEIDVERLSGALTNAVYVVSPPGDIASQKDDTTPVVQDQILKKPPP